MHQSYEILESQDEQFQNQLNVDLRIWMKKKFLETMKNEPSPLAGTAFEGGSIVTYGGTLLTLATAEGRNFPYVGHKAGDIDLCIEPPEKSYVSQFDGGFEKLSQSIMPPFLARVAEKLGFELIEENGSGKSPNETAIYFRKHFSPEEVRNILNEGKNNPPIPRKGIDILLEVEWGVRPHLSFLKPQDHPLLENGSTNVKTDDWRAWLALKMVRAADPSKDFKHSNDSYGFKPRDVIDIYNALNAEPAIFNIKGNQDEHDLLRVLSLAQCARYDRTDVKFDLSKYEPTPQNISLYRQALSHRISNAHELSDQFLSKVLSTYSNLVISVFPEINKETGEVPLSKEEKDFLTEIRGYRTEPYLTVEPDINTKHLENKWPEVFKNHPELKSRIQTHPTLVAIGENISSRRIDL